MKNIIQTTKIIVLALVLSVGIGYLYAATWTGPSGQPPTANTPTPINVGTIDQVKSAGLGLNSLLVTGPVKIVDGTQGVGKVLTSDATGLASWMTPTGGGVASTVVCGGWTVKYGSGYIANSAWGCAAPNTSAVACPAGYDNINSSPVTINLAENAHLCVLHSTSGGGSAASPIICKQTGVNAARDLQVSFTSANCGGTLPNSTYVGMATNASKDCGMISFNVIQAGETGYSVAGPGFTIYGLGTGCPTSNYTVGAVFIKK